MSIPVPAVRSVSTILFVGLGGAGQRHLRVFRELLPGAGPWLAHRSKGTTPLLAPEGQAIEGGSLSEHYHVTLVDTLDEGLDRRPDVVVVANPTAFHLDVVGRAVERGLHVYCEKPIARSARGLETLTRRCAETRATCRIVLQKRHEPAFLRIGELIQAGTLGTVKTVDVQVSSFVPAWRPWQSHRELYACRAEQGGGVLATECHEFDLCRWWFGDPEWVDAGGGSLMDDLDVEDTAEILLGFRSGVLAHFHLGFLEEDVGRSILIRGTEGTLRWCDGDGILRIQVFRKGAVQEHLPSIGQLELYRREAAAYLAWLAERSAEDSGLEPGLAQARLIEAASLAMESRQRIMVDNGSVPSSWPPGVQPALDATHAAVEEALNGRWRAIMAMGSLGYGGYVPGWSDCDIDVILAEDSVGDETAALPRITSRIHEMGFPQVDLRCYRLSELNEGRATFALGGVNRAIMLRESARLIAGTDVRHEVKAPSTEKVHAEAKHVLETLASRPDAWWEDLPIDDLAAFVALPGRLLHTMRTGEVANKIHGLRQLLALGGKFHDFNSWSAVQWSLSCRHEPAARKIPTEVLRAMAGAAADLVRRVKDRVLDRWPP